MTDATLTPNDVVRRLAALSRDLDAVVRVLKDAELDAVRKRHRADMVESNAFVNADGAMEMRKHLARIAADKEEEEALVAEAVLRHLRKQINAIEMRIEVGRSMGTTVRAEMKMLPYSETP